MNMDIVYFQPIRLNGECLCFSIIQKLGFLSILMNPGPEAPIYIGFIIPSGEAIQTGHPPFQKDGILIYRLLWQCAGISRVNIK